MRKEQPNDSSPHPEQPILLEGGNCKWYCFSWGAYGKKFGVMYCDERTPDGYTVDASGA